MMWYTQQYFGGFLNKRTGKEVSIPFFSRVVVDKGRVDPIRSQTDHALVWLREAEIQGMGHMFDDDHENVVS